MNRNLIVVTPLCACCGRPVQLLYRSELKSPPEAGYVPGSPTGAAMFNSEVYVKPCDCVSAPVRAIRDALKTSGIVL